MVEVINMNVPGEFERHIASVDVRMRDGVHSGLVSAAAASSVLAVRYTPMSPTQSQLDKAMKMWRPMKENANFLIRRYMRNKDGTYRKAEKHEVIIKHRGRKPDAIRTMPGGLRASIESKVEGDEGIVFVAANAHGVKYATYIHDKRVPGPRPGPKGTWSNLGIRSKTLGTKVGDKFILRAILDNKDRNGKLIDVAIRKAFA